MLVKRAFRQWMIRVGILIIVAVIGIATRDIMREFVQDLEMAIQAISNPGVTYFIRENIVRGVIDYPTQFVILSSAILFAVLYFPSRKLTRIFRFRSIFGTWPWDKEEAQLMIDTTLERRADIFQDLCELEIGVRSLSGGSYAKQFLPHLHGLMRKHIRHRKRRFWKAHNCARRFGFSVAESIKEHRK